MNDRPPIGDPRPAVAVIPRSSNIVVGGAWMMCACVLFAVMTGLVRYVADSGMHPWQVAFFRNFFSLVVMAPWIFKAGLAGLRTARYPLYTLRAFVGMVSMLCWFWSVALLPIAEATALGFTAPFFTTILAAFVLGEVVRMRRWAAVFVGFIGTLIILRPGVSDLPMLGAAVALVAAGTQSCSTIMI